MNNVLVTKERIHQEITKIMANGAKYNLHNQLKDIEDLNRLYKIIEGETCYPGFNLSENIDTTWTLVQE